MSEALGPSQGLSCYGGQAFPEGLAQDLGCSAALPEDALDRLWLVLGPSLASELGPEFERKLDVFCAEHRAPSGELARLLKGCRSLLAGAARYGVSEEAFLQDLGTLAVGRPLASVLVAGFSRAVTSLRRAAAGRAISAHGAVLTGVQWRVDRVLDTHEAKRLGVDVAVVTLRFQEAGQERTLTLHALPDMLQQLRLIGVG